jgi:hypothetical protein
VNLNARGRGAAEVVWEVPEFAKDFSCFQGRGCMHARHHEVGAGWEKSDYVGIYVQPAIRSDEPTKCTGYGYSWVGGRGLEIMFNVAVADSLVPLAMA